MQQNFEEIVDSYINGQFTQMFNQVERFGWYMFSAELQVCDLVNDATKVKILSQLIRQKFSMWVTYVW